MPAPVLVYRGDALANYGFGSDHPFGLDRHAVFQAVLSQAAFASDIVYATPRCATADELALFHTADYINFVSEMSARGIGFLDGGDTPAFPGIFDSASWVVGTTLAAVDAVMSGDARSAFVPIAGLHHAARDRAAGFCVFNDCGVAIEYLRRQHNLRRIAYVDIDAHHGDGVFYGFISDPDVLFADIHEDGRFLYPGTGAEDETGLGAAAGTKLNIPIPPGAGDAEFQAAWKRVLSYVDDAAPEFIIMQCGADSLAGDPITHLQFSEACHAGAAADLCVLAERHSGGRIVATGGGGYNRDNIGRAWTGVVQSLLGHK
ncbi:MAG: acetoin utilization protein AcuC [Gammaproteobacteria bacterium]|nr:acetoin utilization protein AcuC [Gammaproteobacteria bacterium]MDH4314824.1 acetoin utilization protein AcuC [Gammaproteobacteria bacterium]MDH5213099.1 acetoin utilization protein AcuC [Gammaproteobacteria bacterium]